MLTDATHARHEGAGQAVSICVVEITFWHDGIRVDFEATKSDPWWMGDLYAMVRGMTITVYEPYTGDVYGTVHCKEPGFDLPSLAQHLASITYAAIYMKAVH